MPRGGKRPGAGRPKGSKEPKTLEKEAAREALRRMVFAEMEPMTMAQIAAAKGVKYLVGRARKGGKFKHLTEPQVKAILSGEDSEFEVLELWEKLPNVQAYTDLMDRALDKAAQPMKVDGDLNLNVNLADRLEAGRRRLAKAKRG